VNKHLKKAVLVVNEELDEDELLLEEDLLEEISHKDKEKELRYSVPVLAVNFPSLPVKPVSVTGSGLGGSSLKSRPASLSRISQVIEEDDEDERMLRREDF
jgi:hypothetical protein